VNAEIETSSPTACVATVMELASAYRDVLVDLERCT
jgi:hypothetical protein